MNKKSLAYLLPIRIILFALVFIIGAWITKQELKELSNWWSVIATVINIETILIIVLAARKAKTNYWEVINYEKGKTTVKQVIVSVIWIVLVGTVGMYLAGFICYGVIPYSPPMMIAPIPVALAVINFILMPITVVFAEDALYLGCGVNSIKNKYAAIIVPALFFAVQHCFIPTIFDAKYMIYRFLSFLPLTIILCIYYRKKKNPVPIMIGHAVIDVATVALILATSINPGFYTMMCNM